MTRNKIINEIIQILQKQPNIKYQLKEKLIRNKCVK